VVCFLFLMSGVCGCVSLVIYFYGLCVFHSTFFLFSDAIIYATGPPNRLKLHDELTIDRAFWIKDIRTHDKYGAVAYEVWGCGSITAVCGGR